MVFQHSVRTAQRYKEKTKTANFLEGNFKKDSFTRLAEGLRKDNGVQEAEREENVRQKKRESVTFFQNACVYRRFER